jgi:F-type H+-transporting ATPase subunit gamma
LAKIDVNKAQKSKKNSAKPTIADRIYFVIGTERGLCGKFNKTLIENAKNWILAQNNNSYQIWAMGSRMIRDLERANVRVHWKKSLPASNLITYQETFDFTQNIIKQYENYAFNHFFVLSNQIITGGNYEFKTIELLPYQILFEKNMDVQTDKIWPPSIIETKPEKIYRQLIQHFLASGFYRVLLKSAAAEHSARYTLMEEAKGNAEDIIEELMRTINAERKKQITKEMQELASGSGLLDRQG